MTRSALRYLALLLLLTPLLGGLRLLIEREALGSPPQVVTQFVEVPQPVYVEVPVPNVVVIHVPADAAVSASEGDEAARASAPFSSPQADEAPTAVGPAGGSLSVPFVQTNGLTTLAAPRFVTGQVEPSTAPAAPILAEIGTAPDGAAETAGQPQQAATGADNPSTSSEPSDTSARAELPRAPQQLVTASASDDSRRSDHSRASSKDSGDGKNDSGSESGHQVAAVDQPVVTSGLDSEARTRKRRSADVAAMTTDQSRPEPGPRQRRDVHDRSGPGVTQSNDGGSDPGTSSDSSPNLNLLAGIDSARKTRAAQHPAGRAGSANVSSVQVSTVGSDGQKPDAKGPNRAQHDRSRSK